MSRHTFSASSAIAAVLPQRIERFSRPEHKEYTFQGYYYTQCRLLERYRVFFTNVVHSYLKHELEATSIQLFIPIFTQQSGVI